MLLVKRRLLYSSAETQAVLQLEKGVHEGLGLAQGATRQKQRGHVCACSGEGAPRLFGLGKESWDEAGGQGAELAAPGGCL